MKDRLPGVELLAERIPRPAAVNEPGNRLPQERPDERSDDRSCAVAGRDREEDPERGDGGECHREHGERGGREAERMWSGDTRM
jgi:hypothetical protein